MILNSPIFISVERRGSEFRAFLSLSDLGRLKDDPEGLLGFVANTYQTRVLSVQKLVNAIQAKRARREIIRAREVWSIGNEVLKLNEALARKGLILDGLYSHLCRDLNVKRKWLEKVIILRRHIPKINLIAPETSWSYFEKGTKRRAIELVGQ